MTKVQGKNIWLTRGDTLEITVGLKTRTGEPCTLGENDSIRFAMKGSYQDAEPLFIKEIPKETMRLRLEAEETKTLEARQQAYVYDIQVTFWDGTVDTVIDQGSIYITEEVD
jgi:hypothetical protein